MQTSMENEMKAASDTYRQFIPSEKGESLEEQIYPWSYEGIRGKMPPQLPIPEVSPITMSNILQMRTVEMQHWIDYLAFSKMVSDPKLKALLNAIAWAEHMHHAQLKALIPSPHVPAEAVVKDEIALMTGYAQCMETETNDAFTQLYERIFNDHLLHAGYAAEQAKGSGVEVELATGGADLSGGTPLDKQFMKPDDTLKQFGEPYRKESADPQTLVNIDKSLAGEMHAWTSYQCAITFEKAGDVRDRFNVFSAIENQHVSMLGALRDPSETLMERILVHEQVEMQNYQRLMEEEPHPLVREVFEHLYREDTAHAYMFGELI